VKSGVGIEAFGSFPDFALLNPGYACSNPTVTNPDTTTGFI